MRIVQKKELVSSKKLRILFHCVNCLLNEILEIAYKLHISENYIYMYDQRRTQHQNKLNRKHEKHVYIVTITNTVKVVI